MIFSREHLRRHLGRRALGALALPIAAALLIAPAAAGAQAAAAPAGAAPAGAVQATAGHATATPRSVSVRHAAATPNTAPAALTPAQQAALHRAAAARPALPSKPTTGTKPVPAGTAAPGPNRATSHGATPAPVRPQVAPPVLGNFAGLTLAQSGCGCQPPDPNAAVGSNEIVQMVNVSMEVYTKGGAALCGIGLKSFLGTTDALSDPRVMYDNVNGRYLFVVTIIPASTSATPALWIGATQTNNPCGTWTIYRPGFAGGSYPAGTLLDYPILGQDRNALLLSTDNFTPSSGENFTVLGIPKSALYSGAGFSFSAFNTASFTAPVTNGGIPMISTGLSYFLGAVPGTGYRLYNLTNSGGSGAVLTLQATISSAFSAPPRRVNQPGTTTTLDPLDGRIQWSPVNDGSFIWFAHGIALGSFPAVRYGAISISGNTATVATAYRSGTSDDFNPSVGIGRAPSGGDYIYLNWAYTDTPAGVATSDTVDSVNPGGGVPNLVGTGVVLVNGSSTSESRFGDYSSVAIDPANANGSCAVTAQQYFNSDGTWATRIARVGTC
jgi:hypothetical protein